MKTWKYTVFMAIVATFGIAVVFIGCKDTPDTKTFTVTFDADGGTAVDSQSVTENGKATEPTAPTKANDVAGLYTGTPDNYTLDGWYNGDTKWDFSTPVTGSITLKAKWTPPTAVPITLTGTGDIFNKGMTYAESNVNAEGYTILLDTDVETGYHDLWTTTLNKLTLIGIDEERTITCTEPGYYGFFALYGDESLTLGENITLKSDSLVVYLQRGTFIMKAGSKIINTDTGRAVTIGEDSHFTMEGGEIISSSSYGVRSSVSITMSGGKISGASDYDVFMASSNVISLILSGNAEIDILRLAIDNADKNINSRVTIAPNWLGSIGKLDLWGTITDWEDKIIITATNGYILSTADIVKFGIGNFTNSAQPISQTHKLELDTADNVIKLVRK